MSQVDEVTFARARDVVWAEARRALKPPPRLSLSEWAEQHFYLSPESSADPGRWRTIPYQREMMDAMTDVRINQVTVMKSARVGFTKMMTALIGYHVEHDPCPILVIQPDEDGAKGYVKDEIEPMIRDCPTVGARFVKSRNRADPLLNKRFRGGVLQVVGARSPANFRRVSRRKILGDEVDAYLASIGNEGDPIKLAQRRSEYYWNRGWVWGSSPTYKGSSRIESLFLDGDQRRCYVPCPFCFTPQILVFKNLRWPKGNPDEAAFRCISCEKRIEHAHKRWMVERGSFRPGPHPQFPEEPVPAPFHGHASFHIWAAYSYSPNASWPAIAREFVEAKHDGVEKLQTVVNTVLGECWKNKGEAPAWRRLYDRRETYAVGTCPRGVRFLTAGVDVQHNRLVYEVVGWGRGKENWSIERGVIPGDTSDLTAKGPWPKIDELLDRTFTHEEHGAEVRIRLLAVDSSDQTQPVYNWAFTKESTGRVMVIKGSYSADVLVSTPKKREVSLSGKRVGDVLLWRVGKPISTGELYGWLNLQLSTESEVAAGAPAVPPGYCHFPQYDEEYFKQLTALQLVTTKDPQGFMLRRWEVIPGREDHFLDARRYARAAAAVVGLDRFKDAEWKMLEQALADVAKEQAAVADAAPDEPGTPNLDPTPPKHRPRRVGRSKYLG